MDMRLIDDCVGREVRGDRLGSLRLNRSSKCVRGGQGGTASSRKAPSCCLVGASRIVRLATCLPGVDVEFCMGKRHSKISNERNDKGLVE